MRLSDREPRQQERHPDGSHRRHGHPHDGMDHPRCRWTRVSRPLHSRSARSLPDHACHNIRHSRTIENSIVRNVRNSSNGGRSSGRFVDAANGSFGPHQPRRKVVAECGGRSSEELPTRRSSVTNQFNACACAHQLCRVSSGLSNGRLAGNSGCANAWHAQAPASCRPKFPVQHAESGRQILLSTPVKNFLSRQHPMWTRFGAG